MNKDLIAIFEYLEREKGINREVVTEALEESLRIAAKKSIHDVGNVNVHVDMKTGEIEATVEKEIVDELLYPDEEISLTDAREIDPDCEIGQWIEVTVTPTDFGRIAAQVARQVITQKLRGAERDVIYEEFRHKTGDLITGTVKRVTKGRSLIVDLGKVEAILPDRFYSKEERYHVGDRILSLLLEVRDTENGGAEVVLSRAHPEMVDKLFRLEVPELEDGTITIHRIVREVGYRTKMTVTSSDPKVDPVGACVGVRGARVKNILRELGNEKIDLMPHSDDPIILLKRALDPVVPKKIEGSEELITIVVEDEDYPIALGRKGMNARLIGQLINIEIKVIKKTEHKKEEMLELRRLSLSEDPTLDEPLAFENANQLILDSLIAAGFDTPRKILSSPISDVAAQTDLSVEIIEDVLEQLRKQRM